MDNEPEITLTDDELALYEDIKGQMVNDIKQELNTAGYEIIPQGYVGGKDLVALNRKMIELKAEYEQECSKIKDRYSKKVADEKIKLLDYNYKLDRQDLEQEIDNILEKDRIERLDAIDRLQQTEEYQKSKKEALETVALLKQAGVKEIPTEIFLGLTHDIIEAKDSWTLSLLGLMTGGMNASIVEQIQHNIDQYMSNKDLHNFAAETRKHIQTGEDSFSLHAYCRTYE